MRSWKDTLPHCLVVMVLSACGPMGAEEAPAMLTVSPEYLEFADGEDSEALLVKNSGGRELAYSIEVSASSAGVKWLEVEPAAGVVEPGGAANALVRVVNREQLVPGQYDGKVTVTAPNQDARTVGVMMAVGQPVLLVDPSEELDFGLEEMSANLLVKNAGAGELTYTIELPGPWITTDAVLQKAIRPNQPQTVSLMVDRGTVPWYGPGLAEMVITSNGLDDAASSSTARIELKVEIDPSCEVTADCVKEGYYCDSALGECRQRKPNGASCKTPNACISDFCIDGVCCDGECGGQCYSCNVEAFEGSCQAWFDGKSCDDGQLCTEGDVCLEGECVPGEAKDCSGLDAPCATAYCDGTDGECKVDAPENTCTIDNKCYDKDEAHPEDTCLACRPGMSSDAWSLVDDWCHIDGECQAEGTWHPEVSCLRCLPTKDTQAWSVGDGYCHIEEQCYAFTEPVGPECHACNPASPFAPSPAPDGTPCADDGNPCTVDLCEEGVCGHVKLTATACNDDNSCTKEDICDDGLCGGLPYACDDGHECTEDQCKGDGTCSHPVVAGHCLIDDQCHAAEDEQAKSGGCSVCAPGDAAQAWTPIQDGVGCDDGDLCTALDHCSSGECLGNPAQCDDGLSCTSDSCNPDNGECVHELQPKWCLIDNVCISASTSPSGKDAQCKVCDPADKTDGWTWFANGTSCDDLSQCSQASQCADGECVAVGPLCDDENPCTDGACDEEKGTCSYPPLDDGEPCTEDIDTCTQDICLSGQCVHPLEPDVCVIDGLCFAEDVLAPVAPCQACVPATTQVAWSAAPDATSCALPNAYGECSGGACGFLACHPGFANCNEELSDGCEADYGVDPENCGECGKNCMLPNTLAACVAGQCGEVECQTGWADCDEIEQTGCEKPVAGDPENCGECGKMCLAEDPLLVGICLQGECAEAACPAGKYDNDGLPGNACEATCAFAGLEVCNGLDDNCDGQVDEGFDLLNDLENCGDCNHKCEHESVDAWKCIEGECAVELCKLGYLNFNKQSGDGCEVGPKGHLYVDGVLGGGPDADGSQEHPFATIADAVAAAQTGFMIHVAQGIYSGGIAVDTANLTIAGDSKDTVLVQNASYGTGFLVTDHGVTVARLTITGGRFGVRFMGSADSKLVGGRALELDISSLVAPKATELSVSETAAGVAVEHANSVEVVQVSTFSVNGGGAAYKSGHGGVGGVGAGIHASHASGLKVTDCDLSQCTGGYGGSGGVGISGKRGAVGAGIYLSTVENAVLSETTISGAKGGRGGNGAEYSSGGTGAIGAGIYLAAQTNGCEIAGNAIASVDGGDPGTSKVGSSGVKQRGFGIYLEADSLENEVALDNTLEGDPIYYLYGASGVTIDGALLMVAANPTNLGKIVVMDSQQVKVTNSTIAGQAGEAGDGSSHTSQQGGAAWGVNLVNCNGCEVVDNIILNMTGGTAGPAHPDGRGGRGGVAAGIRLADSTECTVSGNDISSIYGGPGGKGTYTGIAGHGGLSVGVVLENSQENEITGSTISELSGGIGGAKYGSYGTEAPAQEAFGIHFDDLSLANTVDQTNTLEEEPVVYLFGVDGVVVEGLSLTEHVNTTNLGKIAVVESSNVTVAGNTVAYHVGEGGCTGEDENPACHSGEGVGIRLQDCANCQMNDNTVSEITGGAGRFGRYWYGEGGAAGGMGGGIIVRDSPGTSVSENAVSDVLGGVGGMGQIKGNGGLAYGILLAGSSGASLSGNLVLTVTGGDAGTGGWGSNNRRGGAAIALRLHQSPTSSAFNNAVADVDAGDGDEDEYPTAACLWLSESSLVSAGRLTCFAVGLEAGAGRAVGVSKSQMTPVTVTNSIISGSSSCCAWNDSNNDTGILKLAYSDLHSCGGSEVHNATVEDTCITEAPQFFSKLLPDLHLKSSSPCIDAGDPAADYSAEPSPNGCRVNMGAYGNTEEATPAVGADHCE